MMTKQTTATMRNLPASARERGREMNDGAACRRDDDDGDEGRVTSDDEAIWIMFGCAAGLQEERGRSRGESARGLATGKLRMEPLAMIGERALVARWVPGRVIPDGSPQNLIASRTAHFNDSIMVHMTRWSE